MPPQRVWFLSRFGLKTGKGFDHFGLKSGMVFKGTARAYRGAYKGHGSVSKIWLPVATQLYFRNAGMAFKCLTSRVPGYLSSQFIKREEISRRTTRSSQMLNIPLFKTASGQRTFYYRTVSIWNSMDNYLRFFKSVSVFRFNMKRKLVKDFIDS